MADDQTSPVGRPAVGHEAVSRPVAVGGGPAKTDGLIVERRSRVWLSLRRNPAFWIGAITVITLLLLAVLAPVIAPHDPNLADRDQGLSAAGDPVGPSPEHPLGTDLLGRDYASRLLYGARTSLTVGIGANALATLLGVIVGATAAYVGNRPFRLRLGRWRTVGLAVPVESLLMRATDVALSFPALLLAIALVAVVGPSLQLVVAVIALVMWAGMARIVYGRVLIVRESDFVEAARALGASGPRIFFRHILPHVQSIIIVYATLGIAGCVLFEATLSYLGVGVPPPAPSWGTMIAEHVGYYATDPRLLLLPGLAIMFTILGFTLLGDALRDALDPTT
jgi:peptide/nickel transport system permease protein